MTVNSLICYTSWMWYLHVKRTLKKKNYNLIFKTSSEWEFKARSQLTWEQYHNGYSSYLNIPGNKRLCLLIKYSLYTYVYFGYMYVSASYACMHGAHRCQKVLDPQEMKIQMVVSHYLGSRTASVDKCWTIYPSPKGQCITLLLAVLFVHY